MEVMDMKKKPVSAPQHEKEETDKERFERLWKDSISGDEFERRAHEHIKKLYALRDKQCANS
jgi:hypothetical protein